jgi:hypothetical protein
MVTSENIHNPIIIMRRSQNTRQPLNHQDMSTVEEESFGPPNARNVQSDLSVFATGGKFNKFPGDMVRKSRARNTRKKANALENLRNSYYQPFSAPIDQCTEVCFKHSLEQLKAACDILPVIASMYNTPEGFRVALLVVVEKYLDLYGAFQMPEDNEYHMYLEEEISEEKEQHGNRNLNLSKWKSLLSKKDVMGGPYADVFDQLFMTPFKSHQAFALQDTIASKLLNEISEFKEYILPYVQDSPDSILHKVCEEADKILKFFDDSTSFDSKMYDWAAITSKFHQVLIEAVGHNSRSEVTFIYNGHPVPDEAKNVLLNQTENLWNYPDDDCFTPNEIFKLSEWYGGQGSYEETLCSSSPETALESSKSVDDLFAGGKNYFIQLPMVNCTANLTMIPSVRKEFAQEIYKILAEDDRTEGADALIADFKKVLMIAYPRIDSIGISLVEGVLGFDAIKLHFIFTGIGEMKNLFTFLILPLSIQQNAITVATDSDDQSQEMSVDNDSEEMTSVDRISNSDPPQLGLELLTFGSHFTHSKNVLKARKRNAAKRVKAVYNAQDKTVQLLSIRIKSNGEIAGLDNAWFINEVLTDIRQVEYPLARRIA